MMSVILPKQVDIAFIDGKHTVDQQFMDFEVLQKYMGVDHVCIMHDVRMAHMEWSLEVLRKLHGRHIRVYSPINGCNRFGTYLATPQVGFPFD